ncbi:MAG: hypothetical protein CVU56_23750 [Deltaproteobacteria bacterium HGW-Deltaproteobacteria-14]|jgi:hypothetical protein|nr:MAG: hypothetical protein CVU56_23750 [Deltaproteobacteria bacterium HGW-Deltaproteobacteria-14]
MQRVRATGSDSVRASGPWVALALLAIAGSRCTDAGFQPIAPPDLVSYDALLRVQGRFCTEPPEDVVFPVKVLFLIDQSGSLQCTDGDNRRFQAIDDIISQLRPNPYVSFAVIGFSSWSREVAFTRDRAAIDAVIDPAGGLGPATDYQGALATALRLLEHDMVATDPGERARTKYVAVFVSDGVAEPRCLAGCEDDNTACADGRDNDGDGLSDAADPDCQDIDDFSIKPDSLYGVCNTTQEVPDTVYVDYSGICPAYNQPDQILFRVAELGRLADTYGVGAIALHTVLLFAPQELVEARCPGASASFGYNGGPARALLQAMADQGGGTFRDVNLATASASFFDFDFTALKSQQWLTQLGAVNTNARRATDGTIAPDSDGDGLTDAAEAALGTDPATAASDGADGYSDLFEVRLAQAGFDPRDPALPAAPCDDLADLDGDGLSGCEEAFLGTGVRAPDSDGDGMLDGLELALGTDPTVADGQRDLDFDQVSNHDELLGATDPLTPDADLYRDQRVRYTTTDLGALEVTRDGRTETRHCYDFAVSRIPLAAPLSATPRGLNRVLIQSLERPVLLAGVQARVHVACVDANYQGPTRKDPEDGVVDWTPAAWTALHQDVGDRTGDIMRCDPDSPGVDDYRRSHLNTLIDACLPVRVEIERTLYKRDDLKTLAAELLDSRLRLRLPDDPSALFVPIETFDPAVDCYRPGAVRLLRRLLDRVLTECTPCEAPAPADGGGP